jgi:hypothetical protein
MKLKSEINKFLNLFLIRTIAKGLDLKIVHTPASIAIQICPDNISLHLEAADHSLDRGLEGASSRFRYKRHLQVMH